MSDRFTQFIKGYSAAVQLLLRVGKNGFFVEYVCLATSIIDATLRVALVLKHQVETKSTEIPDEIIYQAKHDKKVPERAIYRRSLDEAIIDQHLFDQLEELYAKRNEVIHRYILSDITTQEVLSIAIGYEKVMSLVKEATQRIEDKQIELGIGMTSKGEPISLEHLEHKISKMAADKHRSPWLSDTIEKDTT